MRYATNLKNFRWDNKWAENITRVSQGKKDYIFASVRVMHSYEDVEMIGEPEWVGLDIKPIYHMEIDRDPNSDTYEQRVPMKDEHGKSMEKSVMLSYNLESTPANLKKMKEIYNTTIHGTTELLWLVEKKVYKCYDPEEFWTMTPNQIRDFTHKRKSVTSKDG